MEEGSCCDSPATPPTHPRLQNNGKTSFAPAQYATFEEILEHFEVPRQQLAWEEEEAEMN